jgi:hypothetical protein
MRRAARAALEWPFDLLVVPAANRPAANDLPGGSREPGSIIGRRLIRPVNGEIPSCRRFRGLLDTGSERTEVCSWPVSPSRGPFYDLLPREGVGAVLLDPIPRRGFPGPLRSAFAVSHDLDGFPLFEPSAVFQAVTLMEFDYR